MRRGITFPGGVENGARSQFEFPSRTGGNQLSKGSAFRKIRARASRKCITR